MKSSAPANKEPKKILLVKLGAVGDLVIASAFFDSLRKHFRQAQIVLLTGKACRQVEENNPCLDRLILADDAALFKGKPWSRLPEVLRIVRLLRREHFDLVFVLHRAWPFNLLVALCGIPRRVGFARGREGVLLTHRVIPQPARNERETYLDLLRALGVSVRYEGCFYYLSRREDEFLADFLERRQIREADPLIAIAPGGGKNVKSFMPSRRWPAENYVQLIRNIQKEFPCRVLLVGGPDDRDVVARIRAAHPQCLDTTDLSFGEMASVFRRCRLFIGNNSGPLHIASAMGVPTLSFNGPIDPREWVPPEPRNAVLYKPVECSPCYDQGRFPECSHLKCLTSITVEEAWEMVAMQLEHGFKNA
ncbi:MAG: glycosyltransferase family 9 protein [Nitrospinales bacterium]